MDISSCSNYDQVYVLYVMMYELYKKPRKGSICINIIWVFELNVIYIYILFQ